MAQVGLAQRFPGEGCGKKGFKSKYTKSRSVVRGKYYSILIKSVHNMVKQLVRFLDILLTGLVAGVIFGIWIGYNPEGLSALAYVEQQQNAIRALNVLMPVLGFISIILTLANAFLTRGNPLHRYLLLLATAFLVGSGLITRFGNQPINAIVITWSLDNIPDTWVALRDKWWTYHVLRTLSASMGYAVIIWVSLKDSVKDKNTKS